MYSCLNKVNIAGKRVGAGLGARQPAGGWLQLVAAVARLPSREHGWYTQLQHQARAGHVIGLAVLQQPSQDGRVMPWRQQFYNQSKEVKYSVFSNFS